MSSAADLVMLARVAGSLLVVLVLVALAARMARRAKFGRSAAGIRVLERTGLTRDASVAVVEVGDKALVLGVTPHGVSLLTVLDGDRLGGAEAEDAPSRRGRPRRGRRPSEVPPPASRSTGAAPGDPSGFPAEGIPLAGGERLSAEDFGRIVEEAGQRLFGGRPAERSGVLPTGVQLDQFPDLASALRAAGRVQQPASTSPAVPRQTATGSAVTSGAQDRKAAPGNGSGRPAERRQGSGSVLDPATWRQGVEALRDLTARKG